MIKDTKLGIGIVHCQSTPGSTDIGYTPVFKSDSGKWSSIIDDTGGIFRHVKIDYETILRMIHFSKDGDGWYMCSMKPIPGRDEEYRASWVYFPAALELSPKEVKTIVEFAESQIKEKEFDAKKLQDLIQSYQKVNVDCPLYDVPASQQGYAFRDLSGNIKLYDVYENIYQRGFTQYEWVLLMEKSLLTFKGNGIKDISKDEFVGSHIIKPNQNEFGFTAYRNGVEFCNPIRILDGESVTIEFKKTGYIPFSKDIKEQADLNVTEKDCKKYFKKSQFIAYDSQTNKQIPSASVSPVLAKESTDKQCWIFAEKDLESAEFKVTADGYQSNSFKFDLREKSLTDQMPMHLKPEAHKYEFVLPIDSSVVKDMESVKIEICSQFVIKNSPFKGYRCSGTPREGGFSNILTIALSSNTGSSHKNGRVSDTKKVKKSLSGHHDAGPVNPSQKPESDHTRSIWEYVRNIAIGIVLVSIIGVLGYFVYEEFFGNSTQTETGHSAGGKVDGTPDDNWETAFSYLKNHTNQISKQDMEGYGELKGLYDIVNGYRFKDYIEFINNHKHKDDILKINEWKRLYDKAQDIGANKKGFYNNESDSLQSITFENYLRKNFSNLDDKENNQTDDQSSQQHIQGNGQQGGQSNGQHGGQSNGQHGGQSNGQQVNQNQGNQQTNLQDNNV